VFDQVTITTCVGSITMFGFFILWAWRRGLLVFS
jgi:hypothetical protein